MAGESSKRSSTVAYAASRLQLAKATKASALPGKDGSASDISSSSPVQKLEGCWKLVGKTERQDEAGRLEMSTSGDGPILQFGSTTLYLNPDPTACEEACNETRFSFEVTDATSSNMSDDTGVSDSFDFDGDGSYEGMPEDPGAIDVCLKADGSIEGDASAGTLPTDDACYKFRGIRLE
jgi:hypothetical protein